MNMLYKVITATVVAGAMLGGTAWGAAQAAQTKPATSASSHAKSTEANSATHQNITLGIKNVTYDGHIVRF